MLQKINQKMTLINQAAAVSYSQTYPAALYHFNIDQLVIKTNG